MANAGDTINTGTGTEATKLDSLNSMLNGLADNTNGDIGAHDLRNAIFTLQDDIIRKPIVEGNTGELLRVVSPGVYEFATVEGIGGVIGSGDSGNIAYYTSNGQSIGDLTQLNWNGSELSLGGNINISGSLVFTDISSVTGEYYVTVDQNGNIGSVVKDENQRFRLLLDTPSSYTGEANKMLVVRGDENGIEFITVPPQLDPVTATGASGSVQFADENGDFSSTYEFKWDHNGTQSGRIDVIGGAKFSDLGGQVENIIVSDEDGVFESRPINDVTNPAGGDYGEIQFSDGNTNNISEFDFVYNNTSGEGRLGVGNLDPQSILHTVEDNNKKDGGHIIEQVGSGNAILQYRIKTLTEEEQWSTGIDHNDNLKFKITSNFLIDEPNRNRVTIDLNGNVGFGTTDPLNRLHLKSTDGEVLRIDNDDVSGSFGHGYIGFYNKNEATRKSFIGFASTASNTFTVSNDTGGEIDFLSNNDIILKVTTDGFVGIKNTTPTTELDVIGSATFRNSVTTGKYFTIDTTYMNVAHPVASILYPTTSQGVVLSGPDNKSIFVELNGNNDIDRFSIMTSPLNTGSATQETFIVQNNNHIFMRSTLLQIGVGTLQNSYPTIGDSDYETYIGSDTAGHMVSYDLGVNDGSRNGRAKFFYKDDAVSANKKWGLWYTYDTGGSADFVIGIESDERMRIQSSTGFIGMGTNSPNSLLHIKQTNSAIGTDAGLTIEQSSSGDAVTQYVVTTNQRWVTGIDSSDGFKFKISSPVGGNIGTDNRFTISPISGNVGIGTESPQYQLHVKTGSAIPLLIESTGDTSIVRFSTAQDPNGNKSGYVGFGTKNNLILFNNASANQTDNSQGAIILANATSSKGIRVGRTGYVNIGQTTQTPYAQLQVTATSTETLRLFSTYTGGFGANWVSFYTKNQFSSNSSSRKAWMGYGSTSNKHFYIRNEDTGGALLFGTNAHSTRLRGSVATRLAIAANGNVGIGTSSPTYKMHVALGNTRVIFDASYLSGAALGIQVTAAGGWARGLKINNTSAGTTTYGAVHFGALGNGAGVEHSYWVVDKLSSSPWTSTKGIAVDKTGFVGIGTTTPTAKLNVVGNSEFNGLVHVKTSGTEVLRLESTATTGDGASFISFYNDNKPALVDRKGWIGYGSTNNDSIYVFNNSTAGSLYLGTDTKVGLHITSTGHVQLPRVATDFTTASGANVYMTGSGYLYRSTSSLKYKKNVREFTDDFTKVLDIEPKLFDHKTNNEEIDMLGYIAEDFDELGLTSLVRYNEDEEPDSIQYDKIVVYAVEMIKQQATTIVSLEQRINDLENN